MDSSVTKPLSKIILDAENNWKGPILENDGIDAVYDEMCDLDRNISENICENFRYQMIKLRVFSDYWAKQKYREDKKLEQKARDAIGKAAEIGADKAIHDARSILNESYDHPAAENILFEMQKLADSLYDKCRIQLTVSHHGGQQWIRGAYLETARMPLNDYQYLMQSFKIIEKIPSEQEKIKALESLNTRDKPGDGSFYIRNINSWLYLTAKSTSNGAQIVQAEKSGNNRQKWYFDTPILRKGWHKESGGYRYYDSAGNLLRNTFIEDGKYYVDSNGYAYTGWKKYGSYYYYYKGRDGQEKTDSRPYLISLFGATSRGGQTCPNTTYRLVVDNAAPCIVTVYTRYPGTSGWNLPVFSFLCSPGVGGSYVTDYGERLTRNKYRWKDLMGPSYGQYATELLAYTYPAGNDC